MIAVRQTLIKVRKAKHLTIDPFFWFYDNANDSALTEKNSYDSFLKKITLKQLKTLYGKNAAYYKYFPLMLIRMS